MHIYLRIDDGPRIIACESARICGSGSDPHSPGRGAAGSASVDLFGGDGGERGREGGQLQSGSRLKPPLSEGRAAAS